MTTLKPSITDYDGHPSATNAPPAPAAAAAEPDAAGRAALDRAGAAVQPENLPVRNGEDPWTADEAAEIQSELESDLARLAEQVDVSEAEVAVLLHDANQGAGQDSADMGSANFDRDHEISLANNSRELLDQTRRALGHLAAGTYGLCDSCGQPIAKARLLAFPRATRCIECKQSAKTDNR